MKRLDYRFYESSSRGVDKNTDLVSAAAVGGCICRVRRVFSSQSSQWREILMGADPVEIDPKHYKLEFENDLVRVLRATYGPGERSVMHAHRAMVTVSLSARDLKFTLPDGRMQHILGKPGEVVWYDAHEHLPENLSSSPYEAVLIELKG